MTRKFGIHFAKMLAIYLSAFAVFGACCQIASSKSPAEQLKKLGADKDGFIEGNLYFIGYHELAHALISEFKLPVLGREEDAADRLAILLMTPEDKKEEPEYLIASIRGWFLTADETPMDEIAWWDEHGTDQQRGFQIACLLYGADEKRFAKVAKAVDLPEDRRDTCVTEASQNEASWDSLLDEHTFVEGETGKADAITISYEKTTKYVEQLAYLKELGLLEDLAKLLHENYKIKEGVRFTATECDEPNAFWNADDRQLTVCYELVEDFQRLAE